MAYITPIKDRVLSDVTTPTSKGYFNVADFERVYGNSELTSSLASVQLNTPIVFTTITAPTITTNPTTILSIINTMLANIENIRVAMIALLPALTEIKDDWQAGATLPAPDFTHANQWETTIDSIWDHWSGDSLLTCPTLAANLTVTTGNTQVYIDCLDTADFDVDLQGSANLAII